jgi:hypothetical protein
MYMTGSREQWHIFCVEEHWIQRCMDTTDRRCNQWNIWHIVHIIVSTFIFTTHIGFNSATNPVVFYADQRNILPGRDATLPHVPPNELAKRPATTAWQVPVGWKETLDCWVAPFTTFPTHFIVPIPSSHTFQVCPRPNNPFATCTSLV